MKSEKRLDGSIEGVPSTAVFRARKPSVEEATDSRKVCPPRRHDQINAGKTDCSPCTTEEFVAWVTERS